MEAATGSRPMTDGLYAAGLTVRDIQAHLLDLYGLKVSPDLISRGEAEARHRFKRPAERCRSGRGPGMAEPSAGPDVYDRDLRWLPLFAPLVRATMATRVKIRDADSRTVKNKAVYVALGVTRDGLREVLG